MAEICSTDITDYADILAYRMSFESDWKHFVDIDAHEKSRLAKVESMELHALALMEELDRLKYDCELSDYATIDRLEKDIEEAQRIAIILSGGCRDISEIKMTEDEQWIELGKAHARSIFKRKRGSGRPRSVNRDFVRAARIYHGDEMQDALKEALEGWLTHKDKPPLGLKWNDDWVDCKNADLCFQSDAEVFRVYKIASEKISVENKIKQIRELLAAPKRPMCKYLRGMEDYCEYRSGSVRSIVSAISRGRAQF